MIVMKEGATEEQVAAVVKRVEEVGAHADVSTGELVTVIGAIGDREHVANLGLEGAPGVDHLVPILKPYKLASAQYKRGDRTVVEVDGRKIGGEHFALIAGPCTVESREQTLAVARIVKGAIRLGGENLLDKSENEMRQIRGSRISMILQDPQTSLNPVFTIGNQLIEALKIHHEGRARDLVQRAINALKQVRVAAPERRVEESDQRHHGDEGLDELG